MSLPDHFGNCFSLLADVIRVKVAAAALAAFSPAEEKFRTQWDKPPWAMLGASAAVVFHFGVAISAHR